MSETLELGKKRLCLSCKIKFYDFLKKPIICPNCGSEFDDLFFLKKIKSTKKSTILDEEDPDFITKDDNDDIELSNDLMEDDNSLDVQINKNIYHDEDEE